MQCAAEVPVKARMIAEGGRGRKKAVVTRNILHSFMNDKSVLKCRQCGRVCYHDRRLNHCPSDGLGWCRSCGGPNAIKRGSYKSVYDI
jgi:ribosomal protein L37E